MSPRPAPNPPDEGLAIGYQPSEPEADVSHLDRLLLTLARGGERPFLSFPDHLSHQVTAELAPLLALFVDHRQGPYAATPFDHGAREYEAAVLRYFAALAGAPVEELDGHVAASPQTALLHGLAVARRGLPAPSVYVSEQAHYDVVRACELLGMNHVRVQALPDGTMDPDDLRVQTRLRREAGALVVATCGTPLRSLACSALSVTSGGGGR